MFNRRVVVNLSRVMHKRGEKSNGDSGEGATAPAQRSLAHSWQSKNAI